MCVEELCSSYGSGGSTGGTQGARVPPIVVTQKMFKHIVLNTV